MIRESMLSLTTANFRNQLETEPIGNILLFWMTYPVDKTNEGIYEALSNNLRIHNEVPRSAILCARIMWTFSAAYRKFNKNEYLSLAGHAYAYLKGVFWDHDHGGLYWSVDDQGNPVRNRKHHYAQAFGIYGLSEYYRATGDPQNLEFAKDLFHLLEEHAYDGKNGGYIEGSSRSWDTLDDLRLSTKEGDWRKSMNTMLHILEAYTKVLRAWDDARLTAQHKFLIETFLEWIIDPKTHHCRLFFDDQWRSQQPLISYGHDIEGSWLLVEAAEIRGDDVLLARVQDVSIQMAEVVYCQGRDSDGSLFYEGTLQKITEAYKSWWVQAGAVVGFLNAYQLSNKAYFAQAAQQCWSYIQTKLVDRTHGDWHKQRNPDGTVNHHIFKTDPWECPYHHNRACLEMLERLQRRSRN
jgi:mannobiose 2-epimerase